MAVMTRTGPGQHLIRGRGRFGLGFGLRGIRVRVRVGVGVRVRVRVRVRATPSARQHPAIVTEAKARPAAHATRAWYRGDVGEM